MSADLNQAISSLYAELGSVEARSLEIKKMINNLSAMLGESLPFSNVETTVGFGNQSIKPDQFLEKGYLLPLKSI